MDIRQKHVDEILNDLELLKKEHRVVHGDCWNSCPLSGECCNDDAEHKCNCDAEDQHIEVDKVKDKFQLLMLHID